MLDFPSNPAIGDTYTGPDGQVWVWNGVTWSFGTGSTPTPPPSGGVTVGDTPPANPTLGQLWWDSVSGQLMIWFVGTSGSQWVVANS